MRTKDSKSRARQVNNQLYVIICLFGQRHVIFKDGDSILSQSTLGDEF